MKVLLVTDQFLKPVNNEIIGSKNFTSILKRLTTLGEVYVCALKATEDLRTVQVFDDPIKNYVNPANVSFIRKSFIWPSHSTLKVLKDAIQKVDLVVGYVPSLNAEVAEILTHKAGKKYFALMVACPWDGLWNQDWKRKIAAPYRYLMNRRVLGYADYSLYVTSRFLQRRYPSKCMTIGLSDVVLLSLDDSILKNRLRYIDKKKADQEIKLATTAMVNVRYKGQQFMIKALRLLKDQGFNNYHYYLIGGGNGERLKNLAIKLGVSDQVHFMGKLPHDKVFEFLDSIDIYVHPSLQEGLPRSVVEAMSRALPCIGTNTAAIPELLDEHFIIKRKSPKGLVKCILELRDKDIQKRQATRNFEEAKKFECNILDKKRNEFYKQIRKDIENSLKDMSK